MSAPTSKKEIPAFWVLVMIVIGVYLLYLIVRLFVRSFVYFGYNIFFFTDNMLQIQTWNPIVLWGVLGVIIGGVIGVWFAIKKFKLSRILVLYPIAALLLFVTIMCLINSPGQYGIGYDVSHESELPTAPPAVIQKYFYKVVSDVTVRSGPSTNNARLFVLYRGATVEMLERNLVDSRRIEWMKIRYNNREGYVSVKYLRYIRSSVY